MEYFRVGSDLLGQMLFIGPVRWDREWKIGFSNMDIINDLYKVSFSGIECFKSETEEWVYDSDFKAYFH